MILVLVVAGLVWVVLSPDRVASPARAAAVAAARGAGQTGRTAATARWEAGAEGRAARRKARSKSLPGRAVNATGSGLAGLARILGGTSTTVGAAAAGATRAAGYEFADARELHRWHRREHGNRTDAAIAWVVNRIRQALRPAEDPGASAGDSVPDGTEEPVAGPQPDEGSAQREPGADQSAETQPGSEGDAGSQPEPTPEEVARRAAEQEMYNAERDSRRAEQAWRQNEDNPPTEPTTPAPPADAPQVVLARYQTEQARYAAELAKWQLARARLRAASDKAEAAAEAARARAAAGPDNGPEPSDAGTPAEAPKNSLPAGEGSTTNGTTDELENTMAGTTLDIPNADALLIVARNFAAAAEAASQIQAIAMTAQNLPDALDYGPGHKVLAVIMSLAELAPDPKQLGEFAETLPLLLKELNAQLNRNDVISSDGLTGDAEKHVTS